VVNCNSIQGKASELQAVTNYIDPDVIIGTESKLGKDTLDAEVFPEGYIAHRKDRQHGGGGVFVAIKDCYPSSVVNLDSDNELIWVRVSLQNSKDMFIGSFYRPPNVTHDPFAGLSTTLSHLSTTKQKLITFGGDFNASGINWDSQTTRDSCSHKTLCQDLLNLTTEFGLSQLQREPTRENNTLDLYFTNNPGLLKGIYTIPGISDHDMIVTDSIIKPVLQKKPPRKIFQYSKANWDAAREDASTFMSTFLSGDWKQQSVDSNWTQFKSHVLDIIF
jgi:hypothetical protein